MDLRDVGVIEGREDLRLPREPGEPVRISRESVWEDLQGNLAVELRVGGLPDLAHAAFPEEGGDVVMPEAGTGAESHDQGPKGSFYAEAVSGSSIRPERRIRSPGLSVLGRAIVDPAARLSSGRRRQERRRTALRPTNKRR